MAYLLLTHAYSWQIVPLWSQPCCCVICERQHTTRWVGSSDWKRAPGDTDKLVQKGAFEENYISEGLRAAGVRMSCFCGWVHAHVSKITDTWDMFFCNDLGVVENFHLSTCVWWYTNSHKKLRNKGRISKMHINHNAWLLETGFTCKTGHILCTSPYLKCMIWPKYSPAVPAYSVI